MKRLCLPVFALLLFGCGVPKPHGLYVGRVGELELRYDFKKDGDATFVINTGGVIAVAQGRWMTDKVGIVFEGTLLNPATKKHEEFSQTLRYDGDDLFPDNLSLRLVRQR